MKVQMGKEGLTVGALVEAVKNKEEIGLREPSVCVVVPGSKSKRVKEIYSYSDHMRTGETRVDFG